MKSQRTRIMHCLLWNPPQEQLLRLLCDKALVVAKISSKQVKNLGTSELKASYRLTGDAASLPNVTTVSQHSFDLASERENKAPVTSLSRVATVLCMYVIAHTSCVIYSRMLLSMFPLLFAAQAYPWAPFDLVSDGDLFECPYPSSLFLFDLVSSSAHSAFLLHGTASTARGVTVSRRGDYALLSLRQSLHSGSLRVLQSLGLCVRPGLGQICGSRSLCGTSCVHRCWRSPGH